MKTFTLTQIGILTLALSFSTIALAERGSTDRQQNMQRYTQILDLTEEQQAQLQEHREQRLGQRQGKREQMGQQAKRKGDCDMKASSREERQEMRQERRQSRES